MTGVLRGFDQFMNIVLDETVDDGAPDKNDIGLVVIRGNSVRRWVGDLGLYG